ncbi:MAG TPA: hypothetical protein VLT86_18435 [Vicinamibacterales bacterium]|nr:hypothetical protein [Vicinamibacterales bacterium]
MFESLFHFLFKYERLVFEQGTFVLGATRSMWMVVAVAAVVSVYVLWTYRSLRDVRGRDLALLLVLRVALLLVALFALLRPTLLLKVAVPQQNFVGVLIDDSRSMQVADQNGKPRADFAKDQLGRTDGPLLTALGKRFNVRLYRFSTSAERLQAATDLTFQGTGTRLGEALDRARDELSGLPVAGLVMMTDGDDNSEATLDESIAGLKSQAMPVFAVGVGRERLTRDVQVTRADTPRRVLKGTSLVVDVVVTQVGYAGTKVPLLVEDAGRTVSSQDITLPADGESETFHVHFKVSEVGPRLFRFKIPVQTNEEVPQNNQRDALIDVYDRREKILYLEGEPRPEPKFIRLATDADDNLQVVLLQRTAEAGVNSPDKYLRLGVDGPEELQNGFPTTREELFAYRAIILGSVEASAFSAEQQRMLSDFVDVRGGGLLALGGDASFAEGGWSGTPLAEVLPVVLEPTRAKTNPEYFEELVVRPTRAGANHPATQITDKEADAPAKWRDLPPLTSLNPVREAKAGATVLLTGIDSHNREQIVLAYQRYGRGKALALPVQDTWMWRMHAKMAVDDPTHHNFWQRMVRWLVEGVPDRVMVTTSPDHLQKGEPITITAEVVDPEYKGIDDGRITAHVTSASGKTEDVPMAWTVKREGEYTATYTPGEDGIVKVVVGGSDRDGKDVTRGNATVRVAPSDAEYFDAAMRAPLLKRLADETEGRFFKADDVSSVVDAITYSGKGITVVEDRELWDMPIVLLLLLATMGAEWMYRRAKGLA